MDSENATQAALVCADAVSGLRYIEQHYGRLAGVGWDRVFDAYEALCLSAPPSTVPISREGEDCQRCQGNGEIVTDWDRYLHAHDGDKGDEAVAECPDCDGQGASTPTPQGDVAASEGVYPHGEHCECASCCQQFYAQPPASIEDEARELLAKEYEVEGATHLAEQVRTSPILSYAIKTPLRAIIAALALRQSVAGEQAEARSISEGRLIRLDAAVARALALQAEVRRLQTERDLYRKLAVREGWSHKLADAYGREEYQKSREAEIDGLVERWLPEALRPAAIADQGEGRS